MPRRRIRARLVRKPHAKFESIQPQTLVKYKKALSCFFDFLRDRQLPWPQTWESVDHTASEFINVLYQDEQPLGVAGDFLCGLKRLCPRTKKALAYVFAVLQNWVKAVPRTRATPITYDLVTGMASAALLRNMPRFACLLLVGFLCLFKVRRGSFAASGRHHLPGAQ